MKLKILIIMIVCFISGVAIAAPFEKETCNLGWEHVKHAHNEASYQHAWCSAHNGIEEYENTDKTRVDCLTDTHAVEFDFANKWAESIGQALHYGRMTGKKPKVVLILENSKTQKRYYYRVKELAKIYNFDVEYITNNIIKVDTNGHCNQPACKCHKQ